MGRHRSHTAATAPLGDDARTAVPGAPTAVPTLPHGPVEAAGSGARDGLLLGRYRLGRRLGAGGFGVVYRARDLRLERDVAVKAIARTRGGDRAEREARAAARLSHPGIVALYELAGDEEAVYLVSELVHGRTFAELDRAGALSDRDVAQVGAAVGWALTHAHVRGVIHRDVKPQNVLVVAEPAAGEGSAKLTDFGVAHLVGDEPLTRTGDVVGTLAYMAPEQADGRPARAPADVYALALMVYEGLTGENPVRAESAAATARRLGRRLPPLRSRRRDLPPGLCRAIDDALDARPERRPPVDVLARVLADHAPRLSAAGGLVDAGTLERVGLALRARDADAAPTPAPARGRRARGLPTPRLPARVGAGLAAGAAAYATLAPAAPALGLPAGTAPAAPAAAIVVALAVAALPRLGWTAAAAALLAWLAVPATGLDGFALLLAPALVAAPVLLALAPALWSLPALAPALGAVGLAPAFAAVAGQARTPLRRAGLAVAAWLTLLAIELASGERLLFGLAPATEASARSAPAAARAVAALPAEAVLAPALLWGALAVALPIAVRGRTFAADAAGAALWALGLVAGHLAVAEALAGTAGAGGARGVVVGALAAGAAALLASTARARERARPVAVEPPDVP